MTRQTIIVGISGASGLQYGIKALELLKPLDIDVHLVLSPGAERTAVLECGIEADAVRSMAGVVHSPADLGAPIASGSFPAMAMLVVPCSMRSLAAIAHGLSDNLLTRAADVTLKERRRLVLMTRETPLNLAHIDNMRAVTLMGGVIMPPVPAWYGRPQSVDDIVTQSTARAIALCGIAMPALKRWNGSGVS